MSTLEEVISKAVNNAVQKYMDVFLQIVSEKYQINQDELKELLCKKSSTPIAETDYAKFNIKQLRNLCKERNIKKTSSKKKGELIQLLEESDKADGSSMDVLVDDQTSSISSVSDSEPDIAPSQEDAGDSMSEAVDIPLDEVPAPENLPSIVTPMVEETVPNTPMLEETVPNMPMEQETVPNTPMEQETVPNTPMVEETVPNTPMEQETVESGIFSNGSIDEEHVAPVFPTNIDYSKMNMDQLKRLCREKGMKKVSGRRKEHLIEYLSKPTDGKLRSNSQVDLIEEAQALRSSMEGVSERVSEILENRNLYNLNFDELRDVCKIRGIDIRNKKKKDLIQSLETFDQHEQNFDSALVNDDDIF